MAGKYAADKGPGAVSSFFAIFYTAEYRKFQAVLIGIALAAATQGLLPAAYATWVLLIVGVLTATGVYSVPNSPQKLILQPQGTTPKAADVVVEIPKEVAPEPMIFAGDVKG